METILRIALVLALLTTSAAGQTYIVPEGDCGAVTFHLTRGTDFPSLGQTIAADRIETSHVQTLNGRVSPPLTERARSLDFQRDVSAAEGVVMASASLKPVVSGNEWRYEHAKALFFCGAATPTADWQGSAGLGLEIYPQGWNGPRPKMKRGDAMKFIAVDKWTKQPLREIPLELHRAGGGLIARGVPWAYGMTFPWPEPGRYMVVATYRRADPQHPERWLVDTSTLTFDVK